MCDVSRILDECDAIEDSKNIYISLSDGMTEQPEQQVSPAHQTSSVVSRQDYESAKNELQELKVMMNQLLQQHHNPQGQPTHKQHGQFPTNECFNFATTLANAINQRSRAGSPQSGDL